MSSLNPPKLKTLKLAEIKPYWRNPRDNEEAIDSVVESIEKFGYQQPIVVDTENVIIAGHTRYKALLRLQIPEVAVIVADLSPEKARSYRIIDNKTSEKAAWHWGKLESELRTLVDLDDWTKHFSELELDPVDLDTNVSADLNISSPYSVTEQDITKRQEQAHNAFAEVTKAREEAIKTYTCPHCGESFDVPG